MVLCYGSFTQKLYILSTINTNKLTIYSGSYNICGFLAYFDSKQCSLTHNMYGFLIFMLINFFVRTIQWTERSILYLFCPWKFWKISKIRRNVQYYHDEPKTKRFKIHLSFYSPYLRYIHNFDLPATFAMHLTSIIVKVAFGSASDKNVNFLFEVYIESK